jgi:hypothetical protein
VGAGALVAALAVSAMPNAPDPLAAARAVPSEIAVAVLTLDPTHITAAQVRDVLSRAPAPRMLLLDGSVPIRSMRSFGEFLAAMGYPLDRIRDPRDGSLASTSWKSSEALAGTIAWYFESDGMMPMLIGHSQGGMLALRTLYELAGEWRSTIAVVDPRSGEAEPRTSIRSPVTGEAIPVVGLKVGYAAAIATGKLPRLLLGQWSMLSRLRSIPDSVEEFTGFTIPGDAIAGNLLGDSPYVAIGSANVRNVELPSSYGHIDAPRTLHLAHDPRTRAFLDSYAPTRVPPLPEDADVDAANLLHAADIWYSVKKHWCLEAQQLLREASR